MDNLQLKQAELIAELQRQNMRLVRELEICKEALKSRASVSDENEKHQKVMAELKEENKLLKIQLTQFQ